jgi:hypothetical protein
MMLIFVAAGGPMFAFPQQSGAMIEGEAFGIAVAIAPHSGIGALAY